jgi:hypothetical protein
MRCHDATADAWVANEPVYGHIAAANSTTVMLSVAKARK